MLEFRGAAGGEEANLFAEELSLVYKNYLINKGYSISEQESLDKKTI